MRFHDGEPMNAASVKYSLERHLKLPGSQRRGEIAPIDTVEAVDDLTVRITLKTPFRAFAGAVHRPGRHDRLAQGRRAAGRQVRHRAGLRRAVPVRRAGAAGPHRVEKFDDYWNKDAIQIKRIEFRPIPDTTVRLTNLRAGQLDLIERLAPTDLAQVKRDPS